MNSICVDAIPTQHWRRKGRRIPPVKRAWKMMSLRLLITAPCRGNHHGASWGWKKTMRLVVSLLLRFWADRRHHQTRRWGMSHPPPCPALSPLDPAVTRIITSFQSWASRFGFIIQSNRMPPSRFFFKKKQLTRLLFKNIGERNKGRYNTVGFISIIPMTCWQLVCLPIRRGGGGRQGIIL